MRLSLFPALLLGVVLSLPVQAQVSLDSTMAADTVVSKAFAVLPENDDSISEEEDTDSIIPAFSADSLLSWTRYSAARCWRQSRRV